VKSHFYWKQIAPLKLQLKDAIPIPELRELHRRRPAVHLAFAVRQFAIVGLCGVALWRLHNPLLWVPVAVLQGFTFFNMTTLLHEVVHNSIFATTQKGWDRVFGLAYAMTSGISASQFTRWHLDHHDNLGSYEDDPKRHWLSPKRNARWYKLLYCTPVLIPLYFRAAAQEVATYEPELQRRIRRERLATIAFQLGIAAVLSYFGGFGAAWRVQLFPYLFVFPVAFTLNRLGQHYNIDPTNPLKWSTLMRPSRMWDFLFLSSNYHLEHHYFPRVPFYNLRKAHMRLRPLYATLGLKAHTYREIVWQWFVLNRAPHTNWERTSGIPSHPGSPSEPGGHKDAPRTVAEPRQNSVAARVSTV
jgi:fatty acid desaturase